MSCCGQRRTSLVIPPATRTDASLRRPATPDALAASPPAHPPLGRQRRSESAAPPFAPVSLRYLNATPIRVTGPVTGVQYYFPDSGALQAVDARDATAFLRSRLFTLGD
jgi:hypothetical protein